MEISRRNLMTAAAAAGLLMVPGVAAYGKTASASTGYEPRPLPFRPGSLRGISERLIVSHHARNYAGAVRRLNSILDSLSSLPADAKPYQVAGLKREELVARNSMILHEYYFDNLGGDGKPADEISKQLKGSFGSVDDWQHDFELTGQSLSGGSGWVILAYSPRDRKLHNVWCADHTVGLADSTPLLVMDMYEHSYQMDYGADAKAYIDAFFENINWERVDERLRRCAV